MRDFSRVGLVGPRPFGCTGTIGARREVAWGADGPRRFLSVVQLSVELQGSLVSLELPLLIVRTSARNLRGSSYANCDTVTSSPVP